VSNDHFDRSCTDRNPALPDQNLPRLTDLKLLEQVNVSLADCLDGESVSIEGGRSQPRNVLALARTIAALGKRSLGPRKAERNAISPEENARLAALSKLAEDRMRHYREHGPDIM